jgi:hypothetical protein
LLALEQLKHSWSSGVMPNRNQPPATEDVPLMCDRCLVILQPGSGNFYQVTVEAVADPSPPDISNEDLSADINARIKQLIASMNDLSKQEAMDQVCRRLIFCLCGRCYRLWIENPTGRVFG